LLFLPLRCDVLICDTECVHRFFDGLPFVGTVISTKNVQTRTVCVDHFDLLCGLSVRCSRMSCAVGVFCDVIK
jgi:hypothetical protein